MIKVELIDGKIVLHALGLSADTSVPGVFSNAEFKSRLEQIGATGAYSDCISAPEVIESLDDLTFDLDKAKEVAKDQLRLARSKELAALDIEMMKRQEENLLGLASKDVKEIAEKKKKLRDFPGHYVWSVDMSIDEIKSIELSYFLS